MKAPGGDEGPAVDAVVSVVAVEIGRPGQWE